MEMTFHGELAIGSLRFLHLQSPVFSQKHVVRINTSQQHSPTVTNTGIVKKIYPNCRALFSVNYEKSLSFEGIQAHTNDILLTDH